MATKPERERRACRGGSLARRSRSLFVDKQHLILSYYLVA
jgi:hypothetical protein